MTTWSKPHGGRPGWKPSTDERAHGDREVPATEDERVLRWWADLPPSVALGSREARLTGRKLQQLVHVNLVMSPERFKFLFHDIGDTATQSSPVNPS